MDTFIEGDAALGYTAWFAGMRQQVKHFQHDFEDSGGYAEGD